MGKTGFAIGQRLAALFAATALAGAMWALPAHAITWGEPDAAGGYPNVGAFMVEVADGDGATEILPLCSGTLIHERVLLTAAHCTALAAERIASGQWLAAYVSFDFDLAQPGGTLWEVAEIHTHPEYDDFADPLITHDVGALVLAESVTGIAPAALPEAGLLDRLKRERVLRPNGGGEAATFTMVGYGGTLSWHGGGPDGSGSPPDISYEDLRLVAESGYASLLPTQLHVNQNTILDYEGTCYGDSGGPAFWEPDADTRILVGITSWGDRMCVAAGFSYRVDISDTLGFVDGVIEAFPEDGR